MSVQTPLKISKPTAFLLTKLPNSFERSFFIAACSEGVFSAEIQACMRKEGTRRNCGQVKAWILFCLFSCLLFFCCEVKEKRTLFDPTTANHKIEDNKEKGCWRCMHKLGLTGGGFIHKKDNVVEKFDWLLAFCKPHKQKSFHQS